MRNRRRAAWRRLHRQQLVTSRAIVGKRAEEAAASYLEVRGFSLWGRNVRVGRLELDIVALTSNVVVVVEVRMRGATSWQSALQSVDGKKQARVRAAGTSLWKSAFSQMAEFETMRFDIIAVDLSGGEPVIEHLIAAF